MEKAEKCFKVGKLNEEEKEGEYQKLRVKWNKVIVKREGGMEEEWLSF